MSEAILRFKKHCSACKKTYRRKHSCFARVRQISGIQSYLSGTSAEHQDLVSWAKAQFRELDVDTKTFLVNYLSEHHASIVNLTELCKHLMAASKVARQGSQLQILQLAEELLGPKLLNIKSELVHRKSIALRLQGNVHGSRNVIRAFLSSSGSQDLPDEDLAALHFSQATNLLYCFNFREAHSEIKKWVPDMSLPGRQGDLLWDQVFGIGRVFRGQGFLDDARKCFETCLDTTELSQPKRFLIISALADLYCELEYQNAEPRFLSQAGAMLEPEIQKLRLSRGTFKRSFRRLLLSLVEVRLRQGQINDAQELIWELLTIYMELKEPDIVDRLGHVRSLIALARVSPNPETALRAWTDVLAWNKFYNPDEQEVFTCGVVHLFLCITWYNIGNMEESIQSLYRALEVIREKPPQFLIPGIGTYLFHDVARQVKVLLHSGGLKLAKGSFDGVTFLRVCQMPKSS
ncbi:hypothetical protein F5Y08DRAFT_130945 [Xylaria arbuscula]|nr:hypothetical protein F5Y08DRAFT_130945 [Xylaria arbuscula]